jgi:hypothetical protein
MLLFRKPKSRVDGFPWSAKKSKNRIVPKTEIKLTRFGNSADSFDLRFVTENRPLRGKGQRFQL